jgi:hypothetical protein
VRAAAGSITSTSPSLSSESIDEKNNCTGRSSGLTSLNAFPLSNNQVSQQWQFAQLLRMLIVYHSLVYSYGDSAGIAPDFPFNPGLKPGTVTLANVKQELGLAK